VVFTFYTTYDVLRQSSAACKALQILKRGVLKRLASAVQLRPWPPSFQALKSRLQHNHVPKRSNNLRTAAEVCLKGSNLQEERPPSQRGLFVHSPIVESCRQRELTAGCFSAQLTPKHKKTGRSFAVTASEKVRGWFQRHSRKAVNGADDVGRDCGNYPCLTAWPGNRQVVDPAYAANVPVQ
jgi:hypothetical protein